MLSDNWEHSLQDFPIPFGKLFISIANPYSRFMNNPTYLESSISLKLNKLPCWAIFESCLIDTGANILY